MELKYNTDATVNAVVAGSNRTFMELKLMSIGAVAWKR